MTIFKNRIEAGQKLASKLESFRGKKDVLILGLPRGGVVTANVIAKALDLPLDVISPKKIGAPMNPEYAIGAITEDGEGTFNEKEISRLHIPKEYLEITIQEAKKEALKRQNLFRLGKPPLDVTKKTVIIIDDGMATGLTMIASVLSIRKKGASKIVVATPVASLESIHKIKEIADEVICLETPLLFYAVGQFYEEFEQTSTENVIDILNH